MVEEAEQREPWVDAVEEDTQDVQFSKEEEGEGEKLERIRSPDHCWRSYCDLDSPWHSPTLHYRRSKSGSPRRQSASPKQELFSQRKASEQESKMSPQQVLK